MSVKEELKYQRLWEMAAEEAVKYQKQYNKAVVRLGSVVKKYAELVESLKDADCGDYSVLVLNGEDVPSDIPRELESVQIFKKDYIKYKKFQKITNQLW